MMTLVWMAALAVAFVLACSLPGWLHTRDQSMRDAALDESIRRIKARRLRALSRDERDQARRDYDDEDRWLQEGP